MRNKSAAVQGGRGSSQSKSAAGVPDVVAPATISPATRVGLLAPGGPAVLPALDEVRSRYSFYTGKKALFKLCQNLAEEGLATTRSWEKSKADPLAFIDESLRESSYVVPAEAAPKERQRGHETPVLAVGTMNTCSKSLPEQKVSMRWP